MISVFASRFASPHAMVFPQPSTDPAIGLDQSDVPMDTDETITVTVKTIKELHTPMDVDDQIDHEQSRDYRLVVCVDLLNVYGCLNNNGVGLKNVEERGAALATFLLNFCKQTYNTDMKGISEVTFVLTGKCWVSGNQNSVMDFVPLTSGEMPILVKKVWDILGENRTSIPTLDIRIESYFVRPKHGGSMGSVERPLANFLYQHQTDPHHAKSSDDLCLLYVAGQKREAGVKRVIAISGDKSISTDLSGYSGIPNYVIQCFHRNLVVDTFFIKTTFNTVVSSEGSGLTLFERETTVSTLVEQPLFSNVFEPDRKNALEGVLIMRS